MSRKVFTKEQEEYLREIYLGKFNEDITNMINEKFGTNFNEGQISRTKYRLGLKSGYQKPRTNKGQFVKGQKPIYIVPKGTRNSPATEFKKGNKPANWKPLGSERICSKDGYILVKVADGQLQKNWKAKHKVIWEEHNGPIPKGHAVVFLDRDITNVNIENLALVTRSELLIINRQKLMTQDRELSKSGIMIAKLHEKIYKLGDKIE
jgi:hypothetical protein